MPEPYFALGADDQVELLTTAAARCGRPAHLLEKDVWVVWALHTLFASPLAPCLTFKGGTSLSKAYHAIDRFSEDVDLTYDMRQLIPDLAGEDAHPPTPSQAKKWTGAVRKALAQSIAERIVPCLTAALAAQGLRAELETTGQHRDTLLLQYPSLHQGTGYVAPWVRLEFGARSTGEPHERLPVICDLAALIPDIVFPAATPQVMKIERTFWEKATAVHVYCRQGRLRGHRFSRHWYDIVRLAGMERVRATLDDKAWLADVARHKGMFFMEKDSAGAVIDYAECLQGTAKLVPQGAALLALQEDYHRMQKDGILPPDAPDFSKIMEECAGLQAEINTRYASA